MYDSNVTINELISMLSSEVDVVADIKSGYVCRWVSSLEQLLYQDVLKFYRTSTVTVRDGGFSLFSLEIGNGEKVPIFDDIVKVYDETDELVRSGAIAAHQFKDDKAIYYLDGSNVKVKLFTNSDTLCVIYRVRPEIKTDVSGDTVKIPYEWIEMVLARIRGEVYKLAGDDDNAAKWLNDYNTQLESFKLWASERQKWFGE